MFGISSINQSSQDTLCIQGKLIELRMLTCLQGMPSFLSLRVRETSSLLKSPTSVSSLATWVSTPLPIPCKNSGIPTFTAKRKQRNMTD